MISEHRDKNEFGIPWTQDEMDQMDASGEPYDVPTEVLAQSAAEILAGRYLRALTEIVATLGPERVCTCTLPDDCGMRDEAAYSLQLAKDVLAGREVSA